MPLPFSQVLIRQFFAKKRIVISVRGRPIADSPERLHKAGRFRMGGRGQSVNSFLWLYKPREQLILWAKRKCCGGSGPWLANPGGCCFQGRETIHT